MKLQHPPLRGRLAAAAGLVWAALFAQALAQTTPAPASASAAKAPSATANALHRYPGADLALGEKLLHAHKCADCHVRNVGGDGSAIYRPKGRISTPAALETMVEMCNTQLNLGLFPEDVLSVAAVLQRDHYRFAAKP